MKLRILVLAIGCLGMGPAWGHAGLTSAGVDPTQSNNQPNDPTLAQVAPVQNATGGTPTGTSGTVSAANPATGVQNGATVGSAQGAEGTNAAVAAAAAPVRVVTPPPPPDPASLPVSVIRPLNKTAAETHPAAQAPATAVEPPPPHMPVRATPMVPRLADAAAPPVAPPPMPRSNPPATVKRSEDMPRPAAETTPEQPADASAGNFIFYSGIGVAGAILLLSLAAFFRGGGAESGGTRSG